MLIWSAPAVSLYIRWASGHNYSDMCNAAYVWCVSSIPQVFTVFGPRQQPDYIYRWVVRVQTVDALVAAVQPADWDYRPRKLAAEDTLSRPQRNCLHRRIGYIKVRIGHVLMEHVCLFGLIWFDLILIWFWFDLSWLFLLALILSRPFRFIMVCYQR